jgi:hypothetical protein
MLRARTLLFSLVLLAFSVLAAIILSVSTAATFDFDVLVGSV